MISFKISIIAPAFLIAAGIFYLSHQPQPVDLSNFFEWADKVVHFIAYLIFGVSLQFCIHGFKEDANRKLLRLLTLIIGLAYAASDEIHQSFVAGRDASVFDFAADALGIITSLIFLTYIRSFIISRNAKSVQAREKGR